MIGCEAFSKYLQIDKLLELSSNAFEPLLDFTINCYSFTKDYLLVSIIQSYACN